MITATISIWLPWLQVTTQCLTLQCTKATTDTTSPMRKSLYLAVNQSLLDTPDYNGHLPESPAKWLSLENSYLLPDDNTCHFAASYTDDNDCHQQKKINLIDSGA